MKLVLSLLVFLASCTPAATQPPTAEPITISSVQTSDQSAYATGMTYEGKTWPSEWNDFIDGALKDYGQHLMPASISVLCPHYVGATDQQKRTFWALLIAAMSARESNWNVNDVYHEPEMDNVDSVGLLQLSRDDWQGHKRCKAEIGDPAKLKDAKANLRCGIAILDDQFAAGKGIFDKTSYWSTLRPEAPGHQYYSASKTRALLKTWLPKIAFCGSVQ